IGLTYSSRLRLGMASRALTVFASLYVISAVWGTSPIWGLINKGMFWLSCLSGVVLAAALRTRDEMRWGLRLLGVVSGGAALVALLVFVKAPTAAVRTHDRLAVFGINPNMLGHTAVPLSILCMYVAINDRRPMWRLMMIGACGL